jgi:hypothetical protein
MKKLGILLVVLAICLPAYGYILVYKLTASGTSANFDNYPNGWLLEKASGSGYLVLDVNDEDANVLNDVQYIDYYTDKVDNKPTKLYDVWTTGGDFLQNILPGRPPKGKNITALNVDLWNGDSSLQLTGLLLGTNSLTDIGTLDDEDNKTKVNVAKSLKGSWEYISGENLGEPNETLEEHGTGTLSVTLDSKWTKTANNPDETKGFGGDITSFLAPESGPSEEEEEPGVKVPRGLINWLEKIKGYKLPGEEEE